MTSLQHNCTFIWQELISRPQSPLKAVIATFGLFQFLRVSSRLRSVVQTLRHLFDSITRDLNFVHFPIDCSLAASAKADERIRDLTVAHRVSGHQLLLSPDKCELDKVKLTFFGHGIIREGIKPKEEKIRAIFD